jgi:ceramide glucosyltransferase
MVELILALLTLLGWLLVLAMLLSQKRLLAADAAPLPAAPPPVSILKPLKGADPDLERNLESFFRIDYPAYEILFGVDDACDPAAAVAQRVAARHPGMCSQLVVSDRVVGLNPKVNNLANIAVRARHELVLISDSNVVVAPDHLRVMVGELLQPGVGLVTAPIRAVGGEGLGGWLERSQLNTFVIGGVAALPLLLGRVCAVGKAMLLRRRDLERIGGWPELARYLAEDQVCGESIRGLGLRVAVAPRPVDQPLGRLTIRQFASRHLRWARLRRHLAPGGYVGELLTNPLLPAALLLAIAPGRLSVALAVATLAVMGAWTVAAERALGLPAARPLLAPFVVGLRALLLAALWPVPFVSSTVSWRGRRLRIGRRTMLELETEPGWLAEDDLQPDEPVAATT